MCGIACIVVSMARHTHAMRAADGQPAVVKGWEWPLAKGGEMEQLPQVGRNHKRGKRAAVCNVCWLDNDWRSECEGHTVHDCTKAWEPGTAGRWKVLKDRWDAAQEQHAAKRNESASASSSRARRKEPGAVGRGQVPGAGGAAGGASHFTGAVASSSRAEWKVPGAAGQGHVPGAGGAAGIEAAFMGAAPEDFSMGGSSASTVGVKRGRSEGSTFEHYARASVHNIDMKGIIQAHMRAGDDMQFLLEESFGQLTPPQWSLKRMLDLHVYSTTHMSVVNRKEYRSALLRGWMEEVARGEQGDVVSSGSCKGRAGRYRL
jgi:hypothetical protein